VRIERCVQLRGRAVAAVLRGSWSARDQGLADAMTPWIALLLGLVVVAILAAYDVKPMVLVILAAACSLGALVSVFLGAVGANDDLGSSWSDSGPRLMLRWAASFVIIGGTSLFALLWPRLSRRQRDRS